jgi:transcriptional regulator with XRE-family HTH domain
MGVQRGDEVMADMVSGPLGPRRRIAAALRRLREESGRNLADVAGELMISSSKLSRLENAQGKPRPRDIRDLIRAYGKEGTPIATRLQRWVTAAQVPGWWTDFDLVYEGMGVDRHLAYEADAAVERVYTLPFVPVLLQTAAYGEAIYRDMDQRSDEQVRSLISVRLERQRALERREGLDPLQLVAVTHESALRQMVGSARILRDQLDALIDRSSAPNVTLQVLPFSTLPARTMTCMYAYFEYHDPDDLEQDVVHIETHAGFWSIENPDQVAQYREWHDDLARAALDEDDSRRFIKSIRDSVKLDL